MVNCASCEREISVNAGVCPHCGHRRYRGYEWKSDIDVFGWPLIHIAAGRDSKTGKLKVAKGIIAIGQFGIGLFTFAQVGIGLFFGFGPGYVRPFDYRTGCNRTLFWPGPGCHRYGSYRTGMSWKIYSCSGRIRHSRLDN